MKKLLVMLLKIGISVAIIAYLVYDAVSTENEAGQNIFEQLIHQPKHWGLLAAAWVFCASAVTLTLVRWWCLVRALRLPLPFTEALRIGFLGYLFNLAPMGIVGGDLLKGWMLAREYRQRRIEAFASVVVDRMIGLYMLFVVATAAIFVTGFWRLKQPELQFICNTTYLLTASGAVVLALLLTPGFTDGRGTRALGRLPRVGHAIESLIGAVRMYRRQPYVLASSAIMSVAVHSLFATGVYLIARGLPGDDLSLSTHFVVMPLSASTGALPLPMGPFELVLEFLYTHVREPNVVIATGQGLVVALGYRLISVMIATVGICYYLGSRQEVAQVIHEAEEEQQAAQ
ncbi:MAG: flippase-like domain-containing protein [Pirellulales bacterium]|nr:flippase-like domain-containing protein [Pirellulales bacterium]